MFKPILVLFIFFLTNINTNYKKTNDVFCFACAECNKVVYFEQNGKDYWPNGFGCPVDTWHSWCDIGLYGKIKSQCKFCKIIVKTAYEPMGCIATRKSCSVSKKRHVFIRIN